MKAPAVLLAATAPLQLAQGHGNLLLPFPWQDAGGKFGMHLIKHGTSAAGCLEHFPGVNPPKLYEPCTAQWYTNSTAIPGKPTLPENMRTWMDYEFTPGHPHDYTKKNPWRAPGTARVDSPCGILGGNPLGCPPGNPSHDGCMGGGWGRGPDARALRFDSVQTTEWQRGSVVEASWGLAANHGGGYSYRLCKRPASGNNLELTEDCFRKNVLDFVGDVQWAQFSENKSDRFEFKAMRTREGTSPAGSMWTRNPIPAYNCPSGGSVQGPDAKCQKPQFPPPRPDMWGWGFNGHDKYSRLMFGIVDQLQVPQDLPLGEYVLSWRWDGEQTPQVWTTCASVRVVDGQCNICRGGPTKLLEKRQAGVANGKPYNCLDAQKFLLNSANAKRCSDHQRLWRPRCCADDFFV